MAKQEDSRTTGGSLVEHTHTPLELDASDADFIAQGLTYKAEGLMEEAVHGDHTPEHFLHVIERLSPLAKAIEHLVNERTTTEIGFVGDFARNLMHDLHTNIGREVTLLQRITNGDPRATMPHDPEEVKKQTEQGIELEVCEALKAWRVFEAASALEDRMLAEAGDPRAAERVRSRDWATAHAATPAGR